MAYAPDNLSRNKGAPVFPVAVPFNSSANSSGSNADVALTVTGQSGRPTILIECHWSYSAAPTGGRLLIQDGSTTVFDIDITAGGPGNVTFALPRSITPAANLVVTLKAGGSGITGKLNIGAFAEN